MTKLVVNSAVNAAKGAKLNSKDGRATTPADGQPAVDAVAAAALATAAKAVPQKVGAAPAMTPKVAAAKIVKDDDDQDVKRDHQKDDEAAPTSQGENVAMVDAATAASVGTMAGEVAQGETSSEATSTSDDGDGDGDNTALLIGGLVLLGGGIVAAAAGGGGGNNPAPAPANTAPTFGTAPTPSFAENTAATTVVFKAAATDTAGDTLTYSLSGADAALFNINATTGEVTFKASPDFENPTDAGKDNKYDVTVTAKDAGGLTATQNVTVTVTNANEAPAINSNGGGDKATVSVAENTTTVTTVTATDVDASATRTFSISGGADAALFNIDAATGVLTFKNAPDFEAPADKGGDNVYDVQVKVTDNGTPGLTDTQDIAVTVTNASEAPQITSGAAASTAENVSTTSVVYLASAKDADAGDTLTFSLAGADAALFNINSTTGAVTFKASPDFENPQDAGKDNVYNVTVTATDKAGNVSAAQAVAITVTNANDAPTITSGAAASVAENTTASVYTVTSKDLDAGDTAKFSIGGADAALFNVNETTGVVTFKTAPDFENPQDAGKDNVYNITVTATDKSGAASAAQPVAITVTNANEAPAVTSAAAVTVGENTTATVYTVTSNDADAGDTAKFSIGGADAALFNVNETTGAVTFKTAPDFENPQDAGKDNVYNITVTATDKAGTASAAQAVAITVTNTNDAPTITSGATATAIAENGAPNAVVYTVKAADQDAGDTTFTYTLGGANASAFTIDKNTGVVTLNNPANFEAQSSYTFTVTATDKSGATSPAQTVTLGVTDVNEAPAFAKATDTGASVAENSTGAVVYTATSTDPDANDTVSYKLGGTDAGLFTIDSKGVVTLTSPANYEATASHTYSFTITATDKAGLSSAAPITVTGNITNVADVLSLDNGQPGTPFTIDANGQAGATPPNLAGQNVDYNFTETPAKSEVVINNFGTNDVITISGADAVDYNYQVVGTNLVITSLAANGDFSTITLNNAVNAGAAVNSEATAETALAAKLGASANANGGYIVSPPAAAVTISDDTSTGTTINASGQAVTFTDDAKVNSSVTIQNFRVDDFIQFTNSTGGSLNFTTVFADQNDIRIDVFDSSGSFLSTIILDEAGNGNAVFDQASAAAAMGRPTDFITFA